jgi:hypothetical protein
MVGFLPWICKPHFQPPADGGAAARDRRRRRLPPFRGGTGPAAGRRQGFDRAGGGAADGAREGEAPQAAAKGGTGQGKRRGGPVRATFTSGGTGQGRQSPVACPRRGGTGPERGKGKGGRQAARKGKGRGLCGTVERVSTREKKSPARGGACKGCGAAGHYAGGGGGGGAATGLWSIGSNKR